MNDAPAKQSAGWRIDVAKNTETAARRELQQISDGLRESGEALFPQKIQDWHALQLQGVYELMERLCESQPHDTEWSIAATGTTDEDGRGHLTVTVTHEPVPNEYANVPTGDESMSDDALDRDAQPTPKMEALVAQGKKKKPKKIKKGY